MIQSIVIFIEGTLLPLGPWGVFLATLIEQVIAPIPSPFVQLGAGFFLIQGENFLPAILEALVVVALPSAVAVTIGSLFVYYLSYLLGKVLVDRWGGFLGVKWSDVEALQERFDGSKKDDLLLFVLRALPVIPTVAVDIFCGIARYPIKVYILLTLVGTFIRALLLAMIGWKVGSLYFVYAERIANVEKYLLFVLIVTVVAFVAVRIKRYNRKI